MANDKADKETIENVLRHLHESVVMFMLKQLTTIVTVGKVQKETRFKGIWELYDALEADDKRKFVAGFASIAETVVDGVLRFIEEDVFFESADNDDEFPRLSLMYNSRTPDGVKSVELSRFYALMQLKPDLDSLQACFRTLVKGDQVRAEVESAINLATERLALAEGQ